MGKDFVSMVDFHNEIVRSSRFSPFNYHQIKDKTNPRYHICNSWNNLPFMVKASQPDDFLDDLRCHFNSCNDALAMKFFLSGILNTLAECSLQTKTTFKYTTKTQSLRPSHFPSSGDHFCLHFCLHVLVL